MNIKKSSLKVNIIYNIFYQILTLIVPLITAPYISRIIGKEGMGIYGYTFSIAHYFMLFTMLGILNYGAREVAAYRENSKVLSEKFCSIYAIQFTMGVISLGLYIGYVYFFCDSIKTVSISWILYLFAGMMDINWFFFGMEQFKITTIISSINKILTTILIFFLVKTSNDVYLYVLIISFGAFLNNLYYWIILKKYVKIIIPQIASVKRHFKPISILFLPVMAISIYRYISKIMLGLGHTMEDVGIYEAAEKLINLPLCFVAAFGTVMLSRITNLETMQKGDSVAGYNYVSMVCVMGISNCVLFIILSISNEFVPLFYGDAFYNSVSVLNVLAPSLIIVSWANVIRTQYLLPNRKDSIYCISVFLGALVNILSNIILLPRYGVIGAAVSSVIAELVVCIFQTWNSHKHMDIFLYVKHSFPFALIGCLMFCILWFVNIPSVFVCIICKVIIGILIYVIFSYAYLKAFRIIKI